MLLQGFILTLAADSSTYCVLFYIQLLITVYWLLFAFKASVFVWCIDQTSGGCCLIREEVYFLLFERYTRPTDGENGD